MIIAGRTQPLADLPWPEALATLHEVGFEGVEVCLENPDLAPHLLNTDLAHSLRETLGELGFKGWSISYHKDLLDDRYFAETVKIIGLMPGLGARVLVIGNPPASSQAPNAREQLIRRFKHLCRVAQDCDVVLAEEAEPGFMIASTGDLLSMFDAVGSDRLQANVDLGHVFLCDAEPLEAIAALGPRIAHAHVENMARGVHRHRLPWEGDMDLGAYLRALRRTGFEGLAALDLYNVDYAAIAPRAIAYLQQLLYEDGVDA